MNTHSHVRRWYQDWFKDVLRFFGRHGQSRADSWDLTQEVYLRLLRAENLSLVDHPRAYIHRIAANVLAEWTVRAPQSKPHSSDELEGIPDLSDPGEEIDSISRERALAGAIERLPKILRATLVMHTQDAMTYRQIAERLGASERMVKRYLAKAYTQLRVELERQPRGEKS